MRGLSEYGKISKEFFDRVIYPNLGRRNKTVLVGPSLGVDTCVVRSGGGKVIVATTDPVSYIPDIGIENSAWQSVNHIASDLATSGFSPQYVLFDLNLPMNMKSSDFEKYWYAMNRECKRLGIAIIGGHTSRFEGLESTVIGSGTMFSLGPEKTYLTSKGGNVGDMVLVTKRAAISTTAILAYAFPNTIEKRIGRTAVLRGRRYLKKCTVVEEELILAKMGVSAMHDATEGGVLSAMYELAAASRTGLVVDQTKIPISQETRAICKIFGVDPYVSLSEGSLVFSCKPSKVKSAISILARAGIEATVVGELISQNDKFVMRSVEEKETRIKYPVVDPYWGAYYGAKKKGLT